MKDNRCLPLCNSPRDRALLQYGNIHQLFAYLCMLHRALRRLPLFWQSLREESDGSEPQSFHLLSFAPPPTTYRVAMQLL